MGCVPKVKRGVPVVAHRLRTQHSVHEDVALLSGLKIWNYCKLQHRSQTFP